jgi:hypothetical protein
MRCSGYLPKARDVICMTGRRSDSARVGGARTHVAYSARAARERWRAHGTMRACHCPQTRLPTTAPPQHMNMIFSGMAPASRAASTRMRERWQFAATWRALRLPICPARISAPPPTDTLFTYTCPYLLLTYLPILTYLPDPPSAGWRGSARVSPLLQATRPGPTKHAGIFCLARTHARATVAPADTPRHYLAPASHLRTCAAVDGDMISRCLHHAWRC